MLLHASDACLQCGQPAHFVSSGDPHSTIGGCPHPSEKGPSGDFLLALDLAEQRTITISIAHMASATISEADKKERKNARARKSMLKKREGGFEIGKPKLTAYQRKRGVAIRKKCSESLLEFNLLFKNSTGLKPLGDVQRDSIAHEQEVILNGGRINKSEPRGYGKTVRARHASLWAVLEGYRDFIAVFKASLDQAKEQIIAGWKAEIRNTPELLWAYPDLIWPLVALNGVSQAATRQTYNGQPTACRWTSSTLVFPTVLDAKGNPIAGSGSVLMAMPLKSARGANYTTTDGRVLRPDLLMFDDVQKDEDADNPLTIEKTEDLIDHTAMRLGGHSKTISAIMNNTIRRENDLGERYHEKKGWRSVRYKMLDKPSETEEKHWLGKYAEILTTWDNGNVADEERAKLDALAYYKKNRKAMDRGTKTTWKWAYAWEDDPMTEISAVQHAYNIKIIDGESVFASECQNEPVKQNTGLDLLSHQEIIDRKHRHPRGTVPAEASVLVTFVDVHPQILDYEVWAYAPDFTGWKVDGGTFPDQRRPSFNHSKCPIPLSTLFPGLDDGPRTYAALRAIFEGHEGQNWKGLASRVWEKSDGSKMRLTRGLADANGRESTEVKAALADSPYAPVLTPSFGMGIGLSRAPISRWSQSIGTDYGPEWVPTKAQVGEIAGVNFDANYWKTRFHKALVLPDAAKGCLRLFAGSAVDHNRAAYGYLAEKPKPVTDGIRKLLIWLLQPNHENHPLDCAVGCMVAASMSGIRPAQRQAKKRSGKRVSMKERIAQKRSERAR